eukprot:4788687-Prymnesium_polylepis.1
MVRRIAGGGSARETWGMTYGQVVNLANFSLGPSRVCGRKGEAIAGHKSACSPPLQTSSPTTRPRTP